MDDFVQESFSKFNEEVAIASLDALKANDKNSDSLLLKLGKIANDLYLAYRNNSIGIDKWNEYEELLHGVYSELLFNGNVSPKSMGEIKVYLDQFLVSTMPNQRVNMKANSVRKR